MNDPFARGGVRRYLDTVAPEEYVPSFGEVNPKDLSLTGLADLYGSDKGRIKHNYTISHSWRHGRICSSTRKRKKTV